MRRFLLIPLLGIIAAALSGAAYPAPSTDNNADTSAPKQYLVAGVAFYNLENLFDTINSNGTYDLEFSPEGARMWDSEKYWKKIGNLARAIASFETPETPYGPAIIGISEIENRSVIEDLVRAVDDTLVARGRQPWNLGIVHHDSPDRRGVDVGLLYNPLYFTLGSVNNHRLVIPDEPEFLTRDQLVVSGTIFDAPMSFIVNHWPSRLGGQEQSSYKREAAARLSKEIADSLRAVDPSQGIIIMGDLNDDPADKSCAVALGAVREREQASPEGFYNPFWWILDNGVGTLCYKGQWNLFDQIIVSGNLVPGTPHGMQYWKATVHNFPFLRTKSGIYKNYPLRTYARGQFLNGYSDHFPTEIFLVKEVK